MASNLDAFTHLLQGKRVLELGSGSALCGIAATCFNPRTVYITDLPDMLPSCKLNVELNGSLIPEGCKVDIFALDWFHPPDNFTDTPYDVILATDVVYVPELYEPFIKIIDKCCSSTPAAGTLILLGVCKLDTKPAFFTILEEAGFRYNLLTPKKAAFSNLGLFAIQKDEVTAISQLQQPYLDCLQ